MSLLRLDLKWLALTLSARGLARELSQYADPAGRIALRSEVLVDVVALSNEIARLLCAHRHELVRIRCDVKALVDAGVVALESSSIHVRLLESEATVEPDRSSSSSADRMRRLRERQRESNSDGLDRSQVTSADVTGDAQRDDGDASHVTRALSFKNGNNLTNPPESARVRRSYLPVPRDLPLTERARAEAMRVGLQDADLIWAAFIAHYVASAKRSADWDAMWTKWVSREALWRRDRPPQPPRGPIVQKADMNAPWLQAAEEAS